MLQTILPYTNGAKRFYVLSFACTAALAVLELCQPMFYKLFVDEVIIHKNFHLMYFIFVAYWSIFLAQTMVGFAQKKAQYSFLHKTLFEVKKHIFFGYQDLELEEYETMDKGDMKLRLEDDTAIIREYATTQTSEYVIAFITLIVCCVLLLLIEWRLTLFSLLAIPFTFWMDDKISKYEKGILNLKRKNAQEKAGWLQNFLQGWRDVKALNIGHSQLRKFVKYVHVEALCNAKWINCWTARRLIIPKIKDEFFMRFGLYFLGGMMIATHKLQISDLLIFVVYYEKLAKSMQTVSAADAQLQADLPIVERFMERLRLAPKNTPPNSDQGSDQDFHPNFDRRFHQNLHQNCPIEFSGIELQNVTFRYPGTSKEVIAGYNLKISRGERIGITGKSGSGKSTLLKLITGMLSPTSGHVLYSGVDINKIDKEQLYRQIGFVMQENVLFHMSIRENLRFGKPDATTGDMLNACKMAGIYDFIRTLPLGLETVIGEKGLKLSGGQRQRIVLARLFLQDVQVLIFDEATSALDTYNETLIQETLNGMAKEKTIIIVAHRESSIRLCDRVIEINYVGKTLLSTSFAK